MNHIAAVGISSHSHRMAGLLLAAQAMGVRVFIASENEPKPVVPQPPPAMEFELIKQSCDEETYWKRERYRDEPWRHERKDKKYK